MAVTTNMPVFAGAGLLLFGVEAELGLQLEKEDAAGGGGGPLGLDGALADGGTPVKTCAVTEWTFSFTFCAAQ
jgi:hypothetical protein